VLNFNKFQPGVSILTALFRVFCIEKFSRFGNDRVVDHNHTCRAAVLSSVPLEINC
jgi:hypothetical protein